MLFNLQNTYLILFYKYNRFNGFRSDFSQYRYKKEIKIGRLIRPYKLWSYGQDHNNYIYHFAQKSPLNVENFLLDIFH